MKTKMIFVLMFCASVVSAQVLESAQFTEKSDLYSSLKEKGVLEKLPKYQQEMLRLDMLQEQYMNIVRHTKLEQQLVGRHLADGPQIKDLFMEQDEKDKEVAGGAQSRAVMLKDKDQTTDKSSVRKFRKDSWEKRSGVMHRPDAKKAATANKMLLDDIIVKEWDDGVPGTEWNLEDTSYYADAVLNAQGNPDTLTYYYQDWDPVAGEYVWVANYRYIYTYSTDNQVASEFYEYWNGAEWIRNYKYEYEWDAAGNQTMYIDSYWSGSEWIPDDKYEYAYDARGNQTKYARSYWDGSDWEFYYMYKYEFDERGNQTLYEYYYDDELEPKNRTLYTYNDNDEFVEILEQYWDSINDVWVNNQKTAFSYNTNDQILESMVSYWNGSEWIEQYKEEYTYSAGGFLENMTRSHDYGSGWIVDYKWDYTNDASGNQISAIYYYWNSGAGEWNEDHKYLYSYDSNGNPVSEIDYSWSGDEWYPQNRYVYAWDDAGNEILNIYAYWNGYEWRFQDKYEYAYDENGYQTLFVDLYWNTYYERWEGRKYEYAYDENGNQTLNARYDWDADREEWYGSYKYESTYDENGNQTLNARYYWSSYYDGWVGSWKSFYEYNTYGHLTSFIEHSFEYGGWTQWMEAYTYDNTGNLLTIETGEKLLTSENWEKNSRVEYVYDEASATVVRTESYWDDYNQMWEENWKQELVYDEAGNLLEEISYGFYDDRWVTFDRDVYSYTAGGLVEERIDWNWNGALETWEEDWKNTYTYTAGGLMESRTDYEYDHGTTFDWIPEFKYLYTYNAGGHMTEELHQDWKASMEDWVDDDRWAYSYNDANRVSERIFSDWNAALVEWQDERKEVNSYADNGTLSEIVYYRYDVDDYTWDNRSREVYDYDPTYPLESLILPPEHVEEGYFDDGMLSMLTSYEWDREEEEWIEEQMVDLQYSSLYPLGIGNQDMEGSLRLYPVPAKDVLTMDLAMDELSEGTLVSIYSLQGAELMRIPVTAAHTELDVSKLSSGTYLLRVLGGDGHQYHKRFVKL